MIKTSILEQSVWWCRELYWSEVFVLWMSVLFIYLSLYIYRPMCQWPFPPYESSNVEQVLWSLPLLFYFNAFQKFTLSIIYHKMILFNHMHNDHKVILYFPYYFLWHLLSSMNLKWYNERGCILMETSFHGMYGFISWYFSKLINLGMV